MNKFKFKNYRKYLEEIDFLDIAKEVNEEFFKHDIRWITYQLEIIDHPEISGFWEFSIQCSYENGIDPSTITDFTRILPPRLTEWVNASKKVADAEEAIRPFLESMCKDLKLGSNESLSDLEFIYDSESESILVYVFVLNYEKELLRILEKSDIETAYHNYMKKEKNEND